MRPDLGPTNGPMRPSRSEPHGGQSTSGLRHYPSGGTESPRRTKRIFVVGLVAGGIAAGCLQLVVHPGHHDDRTSRGQAHRRQRHVHRRRPEGPGRHPAGGRARPSSSRSSPRPSSPTRSKNQGLQVNYSGVGSGTGITDFQAGIGQLRRLRRAHVRLRPGQGAGLVRPGRPDPRHPRRRDGLLQPPRRDQAASGSTRATIAGIFDGTIKTWNASQITALNPGVTLPSNAIVPEVRADSSGTTYIFTDYLSHGRRHGVDPGHEQDHHLAVVGRADAEELGRGLEHQVDPVLDRLRRAGLRHPEQLHLRRGQERRRQLRGALARPRVAADADQKTSITLHRLLHRQPARSQPATRSPATAGPSCCRSRPAPPPGAGVVKVLDWTTHTGGGQDLATGLDYVALPPGGPEPEPHHAADGDRAERGDAADQVSVTGPSTDDRRGADRTL